MISSNSLRQMSSGGDLPAGSDEHSQYAGLQFSNLVTQGAGGEGSFPLPLDFPDLDRAQPIFAYDFRIEHEVLDAQKRSKEETAELEKERGERAEMRERLEAEREGRRKKEEQARQEADKERNEADRQRLEQERLEQERQAVEQRKAEERRAGRVKEMERNREMQKDLKLKEQIRQMANFCPGITPDQSKFLLESFDFKFEQAVNAYFQGQGQGK